MVAVVEVDSDVRVKAGAPVVAILATGKILHWVSNPSNLAPRQANLQICKPSRAALADVLSGFFISSASAVPSSKGYGAHSQLQAKSADT